MKTDPKILKRTPFLKLGSTKQLVRYRGRPLFQVTDGHFTSTNNERNGGKVFYGRLIQVLAAVTSL